MAAFRIIFLVAGVSGALLRPWRLPAWLAPLACAVIVVAAGGISPGLARHALHPLVGPIAFLLAAVPLAVLLDRLGFFASLADRLTRRGGDSGRLWVLAAVVTTLLSLDAAVVLLTPLYVRIARRSGRNPVVLAFQPVLLASLASSALPVSNLTNLIAASWTGASTIGFVEHLAIPSLVASAVGWWCYRRVLRPDHLVAGRPPQPAVEPTPVGSDRALVVGGIVVAVVVVGFLAGRSVGIPPWAVAAGADLVLMAILRDLPWRAIPWQTALVVAGLGVLAAAAVTHLSVGRVIGGHGAPALARTAGVSAVAANVIDNLPALLIALPAVGHHVSPALWAVLVGVNLGPVLLVTGSLASLLWLDAMGRLGVAVTPREFTRVGLRVGLPAALAGGIVAVALISPW